MRVSARINKMHNKPIFPIIVPKSSKYSQLKGEDDGDHSGIGLVEISKICMNHEVSFDLTEYTYMGDVAETGHVHHWKLWW